MPNVNGDIDLVQEQIRRSWQERGLLRRGRSISTDVAWNMFGRSWLIGFSFAKDGAWDILTAAGTVHTTLLSFHRAKSLRGPERDEVTTLWQLILGPFNIAFGVI